MTADLIQTIGETRDPKCGDETLRRYLTNFFDWDSNRADRVIAAVAERVAAAQAQDLAQARAERDEARKVGWDQAADYLARIADNLRHRAQKTIDEWCDPETASPEDIHENYADARRDRSIAGNYDSMARQIRTTPLPDLSSTEKEPAP